MDFQSLIVGLIILGAVIYAAKMTFGKMKAFSSKNSCSSGGGESCGCGSSKSKSTFTQINRG